MPNNWSEAAINSTHIRWCTKAIGIVIVKVNLIPNSIVIVQEESIAPSVHQNFRVVRVGLGRCSSQTSKTLISRGLLGWDSHHTYHHEQTCKPCSDHCACIWNDNTNKNDRSMYAMCLSDTRSPWTSPFMGSYCYIDQELYLPRSGVFSFMGQLEME